MSDSDQEDELLEYEGDQEHDAPTVLTEAIPVVVCDPVVTVPTVPQHITAYTVVVSTTGPEVMELLPLDLLRVRATVIVSDQPVVICHSQGQAQDPSNQVASVPNPSGAYIPAGTQLVITGSQQLFVAAVQGVSSRVSVLVERRS